MGATKFTDDIPSVKFRDDQPSIKFIEDIATLKFFDDGGHPTLKFRDDATYKGLDDVKHGAYDTLSETLIETTHTFGGEVIDPGQFPGIDPAYLANQPFVLANPHHSMAWTSTFGDPSDPEVQIRDYETHITQLEQVKKQLGEQLKQLEEYAGKINKELAELKAKTKKTGK